MADPIFLDLDALRAEIERLNAQIEDANPELDPDDKNDALALDAIAVSAVLIVAGRASVHSPV